MKNTVVILLAICGLLSIGTLTGFIGFHYPRVIENQPLKSPVEISHIDGLLVTLADGRILELETTDYIGSEDGLLSVGTMIDIEESSEDDVIIWGIRPGWVCGTPWAQPIRIPLIADDVYRNRREMLSFATFTESRTKAEQAVRGNADPATR